ncbi:unnamed protein product [Lactuca saligna]|uniref:Uncharacterized protein n=1 Tax=Lactuca saligna TaxID=75948 RepID=A0AA35VP62_LACSI|nr:unnamed protein product [Lactuca saligna]
MSGLRIHSCRPALLESQCLDRYLHHVVARERLVQAFDVPSSTYDQIVYSRSWFDGYGYCHIFEEEANSCSQGSSERLGDVKAREDIQGRMVCGVAIQRKNVSTLLQVILPS